jgi:hypothetical protein
MGADLRPKHSLDSEGRERHTGEPRKDGSGLVLVTYNWCNKCTWWQSSLRKTGQELTLKDGNTFESGIPNWIDLTHGKLYREDAIPDRDYYCPRIYDDGVLMTERPPFKDVGGDFTVDYVNGEVTFYEAPSGPVTADFSHENGSLFIIAPSDGKRLWVEESLVQFSEDIDLRDTVHFQAWAYNPEDLPNKVAVSKATTYKTAGDYVDEARGAFPSMPPFGGLTRGLQKGTLTLPFKYLQLKELRSSLGLEIRVWLEEGISFGGERATAAFYCSSYSEES